jgi:hypothetical protein
MKKLTLLLLVAILLAGCQIPATPQPTPAPVEALAGSTSDVIGVWWFTQASVMVELKLDGRYRVYVGSETQDEGTYTFDAGKVSWVSTYGSCVDKPATYEAYVTKQDGKPAWLRMQVVGSDLCSDRVWTFTGKAKFQNP